MKKTSKRLTLNMEAIRALDAGLDGVRGGLTPVPWPSANSVCYCPDTKGTCASAVRTQCPDVCPI